MFENIKIVPIPKIFKLEDGYIDIGKNVSISFENISSENISSENNNQNSLINLLNKVFNNIQIVKKDALISFVQKPLEDEEYALLIDKGKINIYGKGIKEWFYGVQTLRQLVINQKVCNCYISDKPDLKIRGVMLDISRSKVLKVSTLKEIFDLLAFLKYNHIELYVEGFSFRYESFKDILVDQNYLTLEEYIDLENYANELFLDFVPNQNGFGHMEEWLKIPKFKHLAELEDGFTLWGAYRNPSTLNPLDEGSVELVSKMYSDMLPYTKSKYFNMCFDEPFELGMGKSKQKVLETSTTDVYIDYLHKMAKEVRKYQKTPLVWADVVINHPDAISKIDEDIILIDWGYNKNYPFNKHAKMLKENNRKYLLAGGTCTWSVITSRYLDMYYSIKNAAEATKENNGLGILVTDWGDIGHLQYLPMSYLGFIQGSLVSWSNDDEDALKYFLSKLIGNEASKSILELSRYTELEGSYKDYGSRLFSSILWAEHSVKYKDRIEYFLEKMEPNYLSKEAIENIKSLLNNEKNRLLNAVCDNLVKKEIINSIDLLLVLVSINELLQKENSNFDSELEKLNNFEATHLELWNARNKESGFKYSINRIKWLKQILVQISRKGEQHE